MKVQVNKTVAIPTNKFLPFTCVYSGSTGTSVDPSASTGSAGTSVDPSGSTGSAGTSVDPSASTGSAGTSVDPSASTGSAGTSVDSTQDHCVKTRSMDESVSNEADFMDKECSNTKLFPSSGKKIFLFFFFFFFAKI